MATKSDLPEHEREVTSDMLNGLAAHYNISKTCVFEVSARTGSGVRNMLRFLCMTAIENYQHGSVDVPPRKCAQGFLQDFLLEGGRLFSGDSKLPHVK